MWLTWYSSVLLNHRTLLCWIACSLLHDVRSCIGRGGTPLVWSHHASYSHHLLCLCGRLLTSRRCWRHLSCGRTEKNSDWRENDCTWSKDLSGRVGIKLRRLSNDVCLSQISDIYVSVVQLENITKVFKSIKISGEWTDVVEGYFINTPRAELKITGPALWGSTEGQRVRPQLHSPVTLTCHAHSRLTLILEQPTKSLPVNPGFFSLCKNTIENCTRIS